MKKAITKEVLLGFNKRNEKEFKKVFNFYLKPLIFYSFKLTRDLHESQDIVLRVFNKLWHLNFKCQTQGQMEAYLFTAVKNASINYMRSDKVKERRNIEPIDELEKDHADVETMHEFEEKIKRLNEFIDKLPKACREVIRLQLFGYDRKEITSMLGITESTLDNQRHRAIIKLKEFFEVAINPQKNKQYEL